MTLDSRLRGLHRAVRRGDPGALERARAEERRAGRSVSASVWTHLATQEHTCVLLLDLEQRRGIEGLGGAEERAGSREGARLVFELKLPGAGMIRPGTMLLCAGTMDEWELGREGIPMAQDQSGRGVVEALPGAAQALGVDWFRGSVDYRTQVLVVELESRANPAWRAPATCPYLWGHWTYDVG